MKNAVIASFEEYNPRRYGRPWACAMGEGGIHDFSRRIAAYTGDMDGDAGDLVIREPVAGQVYGYGQKDRLGRHTLRAYAVWDGDRFVPCDKLGRPR